MNRPKAYSYIRMSTPDQMRGDSLRRQLARTQSYADKHGLEIVTRFDDLGVSAFRGGNAEDGALGRFVELVRKGEIAKGSFLIVESMDRLSRDKIMKAFRLFSDIISRGVVVVTLDDEQSYSEESLEKNQFHFIIALGAMSRAHEESRRKSGLLSDAWTEKKRAAREDGKFLTRKMPAWLSVDDAQAIVPIESRANVVREIFELVCAGWGAYSLSRHLNQRGEQAWGGRKNAVWRESYIKKIVGSRTVLGEYQPHKTSIDPVRGRVRIPDGPPITSYYPAVVSEDLFIEAQLAMQRRRIVGRGRKGSRFSNLFTGMLRCRCSAGYRYMDKGPTSKGGQFLQCSVAHAKGKCTAPTFRYQIVETALLNALESLDIEYVLGGSSRNDRIDAKRYDRSMLEIEIKGLEEQIERVISVITSDGSLPSGRLKETIDRLELQLEKAKSDLERVGREVDELVQLDPRQRQIAIADLITRIRAENGQPQDELLRRALVGELQRIIEHIYIRPFTRVAWEVMDDDPEWRKTYGVKTRAALEKLLSQWGFDVVIEYRGGDTAIIDPLTRDQLKLRGSRRFNDLRLVTRLKD